MNRHIILFLICASLLVFLAGIFSDLRFSDEIFHFWFARDWFELGHRPVYNKLVDTVPEFNYYRFYVHGPLWQFGFVLIWKLLGFVSLRMAQLYQAFIYFLLLWGVYLLARELYGTKHAIFSVFLVASTPFFVAFSILLFEDVPIAMLSVFCLLLTVRKKFFWAAAVMGIMFLTKRNAYLLVPGFLYLWLGFQLLPNLRFSRRFLSVIFCIGIVFIVTFFDFCWRLEKFNGLIEPGDKGAVVQVVPELAKSSAIPSVVSSSTYAYRNFLPETMTSFSNLPKYLGVVFPVLFLCYLFIAKGKTRKEDFFLLLPSLTYLPLMFIFFKGWLGYRYLAPVLPFFVILASRSIETIPKKLLVFIISVCILQFFSTLGFVIKERKIDVHEREMIDFLEASIPLGSRILTPEELFISFYANHPTIWSNSFASHRTALTDFLWEEKPSVLDDFRIKYVLINKKRIYDDKNERHFGGWPESFVTKLPMQNSYEKIFENGAAQIWARRDK